MKTQFITPCFVRVKDADKRKEICAILELMGYHVFKAINSPSGNTIFTDLFFADGSYTNEPSYAIWKNHMILSELRNTHIDCGTNTDLFLALAGMHSDTDMGQWFINNQHGQFHKCSEIYIDHDLIFTYDNYRKATPQEIIEHFNNK